MKFKSKILCLLLVLVMLLSVSAAAANENTTISFKEGSPDQASVNFETNNRILGISNSEESLGTPDDGTFKALQEKINNTAKDGILVLENDYANSDNFNANGITISKAITIDGNGYTIDARQKGRIFQVTAPGVTLKNINFVNGKFSNGGAVYWNGANGTVENCIFVNCSAESFSNSPSSYAYGGAVYWNGVHGVLGNCSFVNCAAESFSNNATKSQGYAYGGAVYWNGANGTLDNCSFVNCAAESFSNNTKDSHVHAYGGAVYWNGVNGVLGNCSFVNCSAESFSNNTRNSYLRAYGGAVYWNGANGTLDNCSFDNCSAESSNISYLYACGGAVYWNGVNGTLDNCSFDNCAVNFSSNFSFSYAYGGAVYWNGANGNLSRSTFINNIAKDYRDGYGGAVYWNGVNGVLSDSIFINNTAKGNERCGGGAVYWYGAKGVLSGSNFTGNKYDFYGGAVYWYGEYGRLSDSNFNDNYGFEGGAVYWKANYGTLSDCNFTNNSAIACGAVKMSGNAAHLSNSIFINNTADTIGGAVSFGGPNSRLSDSTFINNSAYYGGAVSWGGDNSNLSGCNFINNSAYYGGVIYSVSGTNGRLSDCNFTDNSAAENGGAVYWIAYSSVLSDCNFTDNSAAENGGAVYFSSSNGRLSGSTFIHNIGGCGGAVYWSTSNGRLSGCSFINNIANVSRYRYGGAVYWSGQNSILSDCNFTNNYAKNYGGAVYWLSLNGTLSGSNFIGNKNDGLGYGGAVYWGGDYGRLCGSNFTDNYGKDGGAVFWYGKYGTLSGSNFTNNSAFFGSGAVYWIGSKGVLDNCSFVNCSVSSSYTAYGGAVSWVGTDGVLGNSSFVDCSVSSSYDAYGGAVYWSASDGRLCGSNFTNNSAYYGGAVCFKTKGNLTDCIFNNNSASKFGGGVYLADSGNVVNSNFNNNTANLQGGAIFLNSGSVYVDKSKFINNSAGNVGGAIASYGYGNLINCDFILNSAVNYGGAVYWAVNSVSQDDNRFLVNISDSRFITNNARYGGAVHLFNIKTKISMSYFENNSAIHSGGLSVRTSNVTVVESNFTDNFAVHGGGAIGNDGVNPDKVYVEIKNSNFDNNHANNYGGALSLERVLVDNSNFNENSAVFGGAIYSISPTVKSSTFINNKASELGNSIFAINKAAVENSDIKNTDIYENKLTESIIYTYQGSSPYKITYKGKTYDAFAVESNLIIPDGQTKDENLVDPSLKLVRNVVDSSDVSEYVENLLYKYIKGELSYNDVSAMINRAVYGNSAINANDNAPHVEYIGNNMVNVYEYISLITPSSNTNFVFLKNSTQTLNLTLTKEALNKTAYVGDIVKFRINVTNGNYFALPDVFVKDVFNDTEFEYLSFESNDNWTYNVNSKVFTLKSLSPSNTSSLLLSFKVKINGTLTNIVVGGIGENETCNNNTTVTVYNPQLSIQKNHIASTVVLGQTARFEITVKNNGDIALHDVKVTENPSLGLVYDSYDENVLWKHTIVNNKHVWTLVTELAPGSSQSFFVNFNTTALGRLINYVDVESKETDKLTTGAGVDVLKPEFEVEKIVLTPKVVLGEQAAYEIVIHNTGETDLTNIVVEEMPDASLIYDHYVDKGLFIHSVVSGKNFWTLDKLAKGSYAGFILYFNTNRAGNITNQIVVKCDEVPDNITVYNNTTVLLHSFTLKKISLTPTVVLGQSVLFEILINNTGKVELTNVYFTENSFDGLIYDSAVGEGIWTHKFENNKHTWTLNDVLEPGEIIGLTLRFNTTGAGKFTNFVIAGSDQTEILSANATVNVLKPEFKVEKIVLTPKVALGEQVKYEIVVHNTGEADLTNIVVEEMPDVSLIFDHYVDGGLFKHSVVSGKHVWTLDKLAKGSYAGFMLYFNTTRAGNVSNRIIVKSDEIPENTTASNNTTVLNPAFSVEKICLVPNVLAGNQTQFEIVIRNTGKVELTNVYFTEDSFDGLIYDSAVGEGIWTHKFENGKHTWTLNDVLEPDEFIGLILIFNTTAKGNYTNFVSASSNQTGVLTANATVHVFEGKVPEPPAQNSTGMDVFKTVITQEAVLGEQITFQIVVHNTGNTNLENAKITEILPEGLIYDHFVDYLNLWNYNDDLTWSAIRAIVPGEYVGFFVTFNTTKAGKSVNHVVVSADNANDTEANTSFEVLNPAFTIEKILVEDYILNGTRAVFEIIIHNTGNAPLTGVTVKEYDFNGLIYDNFVDHLALWTYNGDLSWTVNTKLLPGEYAELFVIFDTAVAGNFTNFVNGSSNEAGILTANATVHVLDDKHDPEQNSSDDYKMDVFKIVITQEAVLGGQITFEFIIHNTGNKNLENAKIIEMLPEGLIYDYFTDYLDLWTYNGDLTWSATRAIVPGEYVGFFVTFNTTKAGKSVNHVVVSADNANDTEANTSFEVLNPDFIIEKILIEDNIVNGNQAVFEIVIHNTGSAPLTNLTVREYFFEGLVYDHFVDYLDLWTYNGDLSWTMNAKLLPGEYVGFFVTFNTTNDGVFTNIVVANSTECDDKFSNATLNVHNETVDIRQICLTPLVIVGNQAIFEIIVQNTGKVNIDNLKLSEFDYEGLIYDHYMDYLGHWINDGITWTLNTTLVPGEVTSLFVVFNTTRVGNFTNVVLANKATADTNELLSANSLEDGIYVSADVEVVKPEYTIEKVALNKTANIGDEVVFEIIVHNTGKVDVSNITLRDIPSDGLSYLRFIDGENLWSKNTDLSWNLVGNLTSGEYSIFYVVFNATKAGTLENTLVSDNLTSKATVEVNNPVVPVNPSLIIKVEVTTDPFTGQPVVKVTVINNGDVDLDNVFVKINLPEGLKYGDYYSYDSVWNFNNGVFDLEGILKVDESKSFYIEILGDPGEYQIRFDAGYNTTTADSAVVSVKILDNSTPAGPEDKAKHSKSSIAAGNNATGNPLFMVLLVLIALGITRLRKRD